MRKNKSKSPYRANITVRIWPTADLRHMTAVEWPSRRRLCELNRSENDRHLHKPALLGRLGRDGRMAILWRSAELIIPEPEAGGMTIAQAAAAPTLRTSAAAQ